MRPRSPQSALAGPITRRRLAAVGLAGGSSVLLAACGKDSDPNASRSDADLLGDVAAAQQAVVDAYGTRPGPSPEAALGKQASAYAKRLDDALTQLKASKPASSGGGGQSEQEAEAAENKLIGTANSVVPDLDDAKLLQLVYEVAAAAAARLVVQTRKLDKAFVLGEEPA